MRPDNQDQHDYGTPSGLEPHLLAVFDILGFSDRVLSLPISDVHETYSTLRKNTVQKNNLRTAELLRIDGDRHAVGVLFLEVQSVVFSDSVFAWVPLKRGVANTFLRWCCDFICEGLAMEIPIRAAISAGEAILDKDTNTYLGKPIIDAHRLEENQDWIGIAFADDAIWPPLMADITPHLLMEYPIPTKKGEVAPVTLDWPRVWRERFGDCASRILRDLAHKQPDKAQKYYMNAADFAAHSLVHQNWFEWEPPVGSILSMRPYDEIMRLSQEAEESAEANKVRMDNPH